MCRNKYLRPVHPPEYHDDITVHQCPTCEMWFASFEFICLGVQDGDDMYCSMKCVPPAPPAHGFWQWVRKALGMSYRTRE